MKLIEGKSYRSRCGEVWYRAKPAGAGAYFEVDDGNPIPNKLRILLVNTDGTVVGGYEHHPNDLIEEVETLSTTHAPVAAVAIYSHDRWNQMIEEMFDEVRHLAKAKGGEYSGDVDRLLNFRRNAKGFGIPMELVWGIYAAKHWDAVQQYIQDLVNRKERERLEPINGRIKDLIVYLLLLEAMIEERNG